MDVLAYIQELDEYTKSRLLPMAGRIPAIILSHATLHRVHRGDELVRMSDPFDRIFVLCKGCVQTLTHDVSGGSFLVDQFEAPTVFGEMELFSELSEYRATLVAKTSAELISIPATEYLQWIVQDPEVLLARARWMIAKLNQQSHAERTMLSMYGNKRVVFVLMQLLEKHHEDSSVRLRLSRRELADRVKLSTKTISRSLAELEEKGLLSCQGRVIEVTAAQRRMLEEYLEQEDREGR